MRISDWSSDVCSSDLRTRLIACRSGVLGAFVILRGMFAQHVENLAECGRLVGLFHRRQFAREPARRSLEALPLGIALQIGRAMGRARECQYVEIMVVGVN